MDDALPAPPRPSSTAAPPSSTFKVQLLRPDGPPCPDAGASRLLVYLPGTDGTGQAIVPHIATLRSMGYDVWCLYMPRDDRSDWDQLTTQVTLLLRRLLATWQPRPGPAASAPTPPGPPRATLLAESFGCCLALRIAASGAGPGLVDRLVLLNSATAFNQSLLGASSLIAATNLLSLFPRDLYAAAQATLLPLLVDSGRVDPANQDLLRSMVLMEPPRSGASFGFGSASASPSASATGSAASAAASVDSYGNGNGNGNGAYGQGPSAAAATRAFGSTPAFAGRSGAGGSSPGGSGGSSPAVSAGSGADSEDSPGGTVLGLGSGLGAGPGGVGPVFYGPAAAANFRSNLLRAGDPGEEALRRVGCPVLLVASARDRLLPSILEGGRLERLLPRTRRILLPDSGHAAMLERGFDMVGLMRAAEALGAGPQAQPQAPAQASGAARAAAAAGISNAGNDLRAAAAGGPSSTAAAATSHAGSGGGGGAAAAEPKAGAAARGARRVASAAADGAGPKPAEGGAEGEEVVDGTTEAFDEWTTRMGPWRDLVSPRVLGFENLPPPGSPEFSRPMLFVGNHQRIGFYDTPLLVLELYVRGYRVRGLAHKGHWAGPFGKWFESFGTVKASPMAAFKLLKGREKVLLFPGGAKEVVKKRGLEYTLLWKESPDFVRLAARCGALIVPFAAVGADDAYEIMMDTDEVVSHPLLGPVMRGLLERLGPGLDPSESIFPVTRLPVVGLPTLIPIPNLQRLYFQFAPPVDPSALGTDIKDPEQVQALYDGIRGTVEQTMAELLEVRRADSESQIGPRLARSLSSVVPVLGAAAPPQQQQEP
ncbi:hypothetical protein HYH03_008211 [Edaphochlamys debaryana]|uniref:Phospholipid/glycerol acyltransferase domain-containing protein n=1 Tax=Edaphochlamys debaryana TaxID=47281 RepID=A0A835XZ40_9CHLO|nr:hypothetical protein HYH03_008211 [Edaphochlamys debaryana]|eukprot:KAG2493697.1 hypothetical protein HYH03_008211 [Edaphochlamys debaryana]